MTPYEAPLFARRSAAGSRRGRRAGEIMTGVIILGLVSWGGRGKGPWVLPDGNVGGTPTPRARSSYRESGSAFPFPLFPGGEGR